MRPQLDNRVASSVLLWLDHTIVQKGEAFTNVSGLFYKSSRNQYSNLYTYSLPFKQINVDSSIAGANIMSGIYINNNFITTGQSGLLAIDYNNGQAHFLTGVDSSVLSGAYSIKDYNVYLSNEPEEKLLFETKYEPTPKISRAISGLAPNTLTYPIIFLKSDGSYNEPFAFGGLDETCFNMRATVISDSQFSLDALCSILRDKVRTFVPLLEENEMPFNSFGGLKNQSYNYNTLTTGIINSLFLNRVDISRLSYKSVIMNEVKNLNPNIFPILIDFELKIVRAPRA